MSLESELNENGILIYPNKGTSMMPLLRENKDLMIIEKRGQTPPKIGDAVLFKRGQQYILHRIVGQEGNTYSLMGDNQWSVEKGVKEENIIGILKGVIRDGKETYVDSDEYREYLKKYVSGPLVLRRAKIYGKHLVSAMKRRLKK